MEGVAIGHNFKGNPLRMIQAKFGEDSWKSLQTDDGHQVMAIAHTGELKITDWLILGYTDILYIKYNYEWPTNLCNNS